MNCAILGATGYTGVELIKILLRHAYVKLTHLTTRQEKAILVQELIPTLPPTVKLAVQNHPHREIQKTADVIFVCLPHTEAMKSVQEFRKAGKLVIDLSADYRLRKAGDYPKWYGVKHTAPALLRQAVYGLTEWNRNAIRKADLIANPGCYPTGANLGLIPLLKERLIETEGIVVDSKSGVSGAGKKISAHTQFGELDENFYAYKVAKHQHTPEILQIAEEAAGRKVTLTFVPHLLPVFRGILSVIYAKKKKGVTLKKIEAAYASTYHQEPFIRIKPAGTFPELKHVQYTNYCDIGLTLDPLTDRVIVITAIDNLLKGASGQAVQNMNVRCGFPEQEGLI